MDDVREWHGSKPTSLAGYLEAMSFAIFTAGINWKVVDAKWDGIREAFSGFDVETVASMTPADVDSLSADRRVIRNHRKLEGIVENAGRLLELDRPPGGFAGYVGSHPDFAATVTDLKRNFKFLGDTSAYFFLAAVGEPVPSAEECGFAHPRNPCLTAPCPGCAGATPPSSGYETRDAIGWGPVVVAQLERQR